MNSMNLAVISDVHGNLDALKAVFEDMEKRNIDSVISLGDLVGYGPSPNGVVEFIRNKKVLNIVGNYDSAVIYDDFKYIRHNEINEFFVPWTRKELKEENINYLKSLPDNIELKIKNKKLVFVHGSTRSINEYLKENSHEAKDTMKEFDGDILFCGHTHIPYKKEYDEKILINVGSVGKSKMGTPECSYVIVNFLQDKVSFGFVKVKYDYEKVCHMMEKKEFPHKSINTIRTGIE